MTQPSASASPARVILVPYPITVLSSFAYHVFREVGISSPYVSYRWRNLTEHEDSATRLCLFGPGPVLFVKVLAQLQNLPQRSRKYILRRILNFCQSPYPSQMTRHEELQREIARIPGSPREILEMCASFWEDVVRRDIDPFKEVLPPFSPRFTGPPELPLPPELKDLPKEMPPAELDEQQLIFKQKVYLSRPRFHHVPDEEGRLVEAGSTEFSLEETQARLLVGRHLTIGVFGPPGIGKSSTVAILFSEFRKLVKTLNTRRWKGFHLRVEKLDLDKGTPTQEPIDNNLGQNREAIQKRPWTPELAVEAMNELERARREANILIVDLPGKIDGILELLGSSLDGAILLFPGGDKGCQEIWERDFLDGVLAIEKLSVMPRDLSEGSRSLPGVYRHHRTARGNIEPPDRTVKFDPYLIYLAKVILYDFLPKMVESRYEAGAKFWL